MMLQLLLCLIVNVCPPVIQVDHPAVLQHGGPHPFIYRAVAVGGTDQTNGVVKLALQEFAMFPAQGREVRGKLAILDALPTQGLCAKKTQKSWQQR